MNIKEMHYDAKIKANKIDSQKYRNLRVPELDWLINEAIDVITKRRAEPFSNNNVGFEINQRNIDDLRTLVVNAELEDVTADGDDFYFELPEDYMFYRSSKAVCSSTDCKLVDMRPVLVQHDDKLQDNPLYTSDFRWRRLNIRFYDKGIKLLTGGKFTVDKFAINYLRHPAKVNNSESITGGYVDLATGDTLTTNVDCDLPEHLHGEIVDMAVLFLTQGLSGNSYELRKDKIKITDN